jgi:hypothetical protein
VSKYPIGNSKIQEFPIFFAEKSAGSKQERVHRTAQNEMQIFAMDI